MDAWRNGVISGKITEVPGIGPAAARILADDPNSAMQITNTYQLIGQYLLLKGPEDEENTVTVAELNQKFWFFLKMKGIVAHRSAIVLAISDKVSTFFPGFYDANTACESDDEE